MKIKNELIRVYLFSVLLSGFSYGLTALLFLLDSELISELLASGGYLMISIFMFTSVSRVRFNYSVEDVNSTNENLGIVIVSIFSFFMATLSLAGLFVVLDQFGGGFVISGENLDLTLFSLSALLLVPYGILGALSQILSNKIISNSNFGR